MHANKIFVFTALFSSSFFLQLSIKPQSDIVRQLESELKSSHPRITTEEVTGTFIHMHSYQPLGI